MARYKISNKNIYGFRTCIFQTMGICIPVLMAINLFIALVIAPLIYPRYVEKYTLAEGAPGSASTAETPVATSIADMERLTGGFTFVTSGAVLNYDTARDEDNVVYHLISLESGERVIARINKKALTELEEYGYYRLPVGVWRAWDPPEKLRIYTTLTDTSHYIDMYGDYTPILSVWEYGQLIDRPVSAWSYILYLLIVRTIGVRRWRYAPALLWRRDPLLPRNDLECWCAATYAIWSHSFSGMEGYPMITGVRGTRKRVKWFRDSLAEQWDIHNREEGLTTVHQLTDQWAGKLDARESGWDLCRATQLLGMMYLVGMLKRDELDHEFSRAGRVMQQKFSSWDELTDSYLEGFRRWIVRTGQDEKSNLAFRRRIVVRLKEQSVSPYSIPWNTDLSWIPGVSGGGRTFTKKLLRNYRDDF